MKIVRQQRVGSFIDELETLSTSRCSWFGSACFSMATKRLFSDWNKEELEMTLTYSP
jgi:hypothetical protein